MSGLIVLTYHHINDESLKDAPTVRINYFRQQMAFLNLYRHKFQVINLNEAITWLAHRPSPKTKILLTFDDGWQDNYTNALPVLKKYKFPATVFLTTGKIDKDERYLTSSQIKEMTEYGITFGAHTVTHPHLTNISLDEARNEILQSQEFLRNTQYAIRNTLHAFCYPYGDYNEHVKQLVKQAGFSCAFSVKPGINYKGQDLFEIKRIDVLGNDDFSSFKYKLTDKYSIKCLAYHSIGSGAGKEVGADLYRVSEEAFRGQIAYLRNTSLITFDDGLLDNYTNAYPILKEAGLSAYFFILVGKVGQEGYMSWAQIRELKNSGMKIGSHGMTHRILTGLSDKDLDNELRESKRLLEENLGGEVDSLSIPRGFYDEKVMDKAAQIGYKCVFTSDIKDTDGFRFGRIPVKADWDLVYFKQVMHSGQSLGDRTAGFIKHSAKCLLGAENYDRIRTRILTH